MLRTRKQLLEAGLDHGPQSIVWRLQRAGVTGVPAPSTVSRILTRHGAVVAQPHKRPRSATRRFCFARPNECWQSDWTQWALGDGTLVGIAGSLDDHSRYLTGLHAAIGAGTTLDNRGATSVSTQALTSLAPPSASRRPAPTY